MPVSGERHPTLNENGIPYVWDSRFGTYIPGNLAGMSAGVAQADAATRQEVADPRFASGPPATLTTGSLARALAPNAPIAGTGPAPRTGTLTPTTAAVGANAVTPSQIGGTATLANALAAQTTAAPQSYAAPQQPLQAAPQLPADLVEMLRTLVQQSVDQGAQGQNRLNRLVDNYGQYLDFAQQSLGSTMQTRDQLVQSLLGTLTPGIQSAIGGMNEAPGLSPEAMAALRSQAVEGPQRDYQSQVEQLKTSLAGRGAYGGGDTPGALGEIVRGYAPLMSNRDSTRQNLLSQAILADEQRKFESLGLNRQTGLGAINAGTNLTSALGGIYSPNAFLGATEGALGGLGSALSGQTAAGFQGLNTAGGMADSLVRQNELQDNNQLRNLLLSSLLGTGGNILTGLLTGNNNDNLEETLRDILGGGNGTGGGTGGGDTGTTPSGSSSPIRDLLTNPITIGVGAGIIGATAWLKSQAHWEANTFVQNIQNPFAQKLTGIVGQFNQAAQSGQMSSQQAAAAANSVGQMWREFLTKGDAFAQGGSDEAEVWNNAKFKGDGQFRGLAPLMDQVAGDMWATVAQLQAQGK